MGARKPPPCVADDRIEAYMGNVIGFSFGLLLGHRAPTNLSDLILTVVTTPPEQEGARLTHLRDVSIEWMVLHAAQVLGYLPEGIDCVGLYVVAEDRAALRGLQLQRHMHALRHAVSSLKKTTLREAYDADCVQYVAVSCPGVPPSIKHFNKDNAMVLRDFKWQRDVAIMSLRRFTATIDVTSIVGRLPFRSASSLTARLHRELESAICLAASKTHVTFLRSLASAPCGRRDDKVGEVDTAQPVNLQSVQGNISCVAYVHHKANNPVDVAGGRLGEDCVRSIARRLAMQQERATTDGDGASILELRVAYWIASESSRRPTVALPRRAKFAWTLNGVPVGFDGILHVLESHESLADCVANAHDVLGSEPRVAGETATWLEDAAHKDAGVLATAEVERPQSPANLPLDHGDPPSNALNFALAPTSFLTLAALLCAMLWLRLRASTDGFPGT